MSRAEQSTRLELERIVFIGRTFQEYLDMFSLSLAELKGKKVLDCPSGACSFTAKGNTLGLDVTACDIAYYHSRKDLKQKGFQDLKHVMSNLKKVKGNYNWEYFKSVERLIEFRKSALEECLADMEVANERYVPATLPLLPFKDEEFDLLLSAHFLFMYEDQLSFQFHQTTIKELLRVTKDRVCIFPLVNMEGKRYEYLDRLINDLRGNECIVEEISGPYEFLTNANTMLQITKLQ